MGTVVSMGSNSRDRNLWSTTVAAQLRAERAAAHLTQAQVIEGSGLGRSTYLRLESGERVADTAQLAAILSVIGLPMSEFMRRVEDRIVSSMNISDAERADLQGAIDRNRPQQQTRPTTRRRTGS